MLKVVPTAEEAISTSPVLFNVPLNTDCLETVSLPEFSTVLTTSTLPSTRKFPALDTVSSNRTLPFSSVEIFRLPFLPTVTVDFNTKPPASSPNDRVPSSTLTSPEMTFAAAKIRSPPFLTVTSLAISTPNSDSIETYPPLTVNSFLNANPSASPEIQTLPPLLTRESTTALGFMICRS